MQHRHVQIPIVWIALAPGLEPSGRRQRHRIPGQAVFRRQSLDVEQMNARNAACRHLEKNTPFRLRWNFHPRVQTGLEGERQFTGPEIRMASTNVDERRDTGAAGTLLIYAHTAGYVLLQIRFMNEGDTALFDLPDQSLPGILLQLRCDVPFPTEGYGCRRRRNETIA